MEAILITGVAGFIGSRMADWLIENHPEYKIIGIDNLLGGYIDNINSNVDFYKRDLSTDSIDDIFKKYNIIYVYHFAAYAAEGLSPFMRKFIWQNNSVSTANIVNACINYNVKRLIYTSSMSVYGNGKKHKRFIESDLPKPGDPYAISKYASELDIQNAGITHKLDWCIIRPHNVFGAKQNIWDMYRNILGIWMYQKLHDQPLTIYGDGLQTRAFSYINNMFEPLWNAAVLKSASKQIINLGDIDEYTINDACEKIQNIIGKTDVVYLEKRFECKRAVPSFNKSIDILGYSQKYTFEQGLFEMWVWAQQQPDRIQQKWKNYEINQNIYSYWK